MIKLPELLTDYTMFKNGTDYAGQVDELSLGKIVGVGEEILAGGMAAPIDVFMGRVEKMTIEAGCHGITSEFTEGLFDPDYSVTFRGAVGPVSDSKAVIIETRGLYKELEIGAFSATNKGSQKFTATLGYLKISIGSAVPLEIDVLGKKIIVHGKDLLASQRAALGA